MRLGLGFSALALAAAVPTVGSILAAPEKVTRPCPSGSDKHPSIGKGHATRGSVLVNGAKRKKASLFSGSVVCTNGTPFSFKINVGGQHASCEEMPKSALRVHPRPFLLRFIWGLSTCEVGGPRPRKPFRGPVETRIVAEDPVFSIRINGAETVVRVLSGSTLVSGETGAAGAVVVGPNQAVHVPVGGDPRAPTGIKLTAHERALRDKLAQDQAPPDFSPPDPKSSPTLTRIFDRHYIYVGLDNSVINQPPYELTKTYFYFLGRKWKVKPVFRGFSTKTALQDLQSGALDVLVSSTDVLGADAVPLFSDAKKTTWSTVVYPDKPYEEALRRFLVAMVNSGNYASLYRGAFKSAPSYDALQPALFPR